MISKPLGRKAYGSISHLPNSRLGPGDHSVHEGQARLCTERAKHKHNRIIVQEKLDGSCTAVALLDGVIHSLGRAGWPASSSRYEQHQLFAQWVREHEARFRRVLHEGERLVGEWLAQAHGTVYNLIEREPWAVFDLMTGIERVTLQVLKARAGPEFQMPHTLHVGGPLSVDDGLRLLEGRHWPCIGLPEGLVYRVENSNKNVVDFLAKWVRPDKVDGRYLPEISGGPAVWNWRP